MNHISLAQFDREVLKSSLPVLVDFYADWCGPCRMLSPILERTASAYAGRAKIVKVNVDAEPELAEQFQVSSIPTLIFFQDGEIVGRTGGLVSENVLHGAFDQLLASSSSN